MSTTIDQRVVEMRFDNRQFETNVQTSLSTLDRLKKSLNLSDSAKSLDNISNSAKRFDLSGMNSAVSTVQASFSSLEVIAVTALANITNSAVNYGKKIVSALAIEPIKTGFQEYETQINAVQTILANTQSKGTTLDNVNDALDTLNQYADKTIYNFTEMTRNIGTFTAAGVDLDTSVNAIQGIANLAAVSGSSSQQASTAMYQLSQALASGTVKLMDWNSVVNAGMGGQVFQDALKETARVHGVAIDEMIAKNGSFRETLHEEWLTSEILTETLQKFTMTTEGLTDAQIAENRAMLQSKGYTDAQIDAIFQLGTSATDAATKVKTFTQLWDTLKESAQSGWTQTWEIIMGDFKEAKSLFSDIYKTLSPIIEASAKARNDVLQGWKDLGGRTAILDSIRNTFEAIVSVVTPIAEAFREIFPPVTAQQLVAFSEGLRNLTEKLILTGEQSEMLKTTFKGVFAILDIVFTAFKDVGSGIVTLLGSLTGLGNDILKVSSSFGKWAIGLRESAKETNLFGTIVKSIVDILSSAITNVRNFFGSFTSKIDTSGIEKVKDIFSSIKEVISNVTEKAKGVLSGLGSAISNTFSSENFSLLDIFNTGALTAGAIGITKIVSSIAGMFGEAKGILEGITGILDSVKESLEAWQASLNAGTLMKIATAVGVLTASLVVLSLIDPNKLAASLGAITVLFADLMGSLAIFGKVTKDLDDTAKACGAMLAISVSIGILASALKKIGDIDTDKIAQSVLAISILMGDMMLFLQYGKLDTNITGSAAGLILLATSMLIVAQACKEFGSMKIDELGKGLLGFSAALAAVTVAVNFLPKNLLEIGVGLLAVSASISIISNCLTSLGGLSIEQIGKGLLAMGGALGVLAVALNFMTGTLAGSAALIVAAAAITMLTPALVILGGLSVGAIATALITLAASFAVIGVAAALLTPIIPAMIGLAGAFALIGVAAAGIGVAMLGVGVGLAGIAAGFASLAALGTAGALAVVTSLTLIISGIASLIPLIAAKFGEAIVAFAGVITDGAPAIGKAFKTVILTFVDVITECVPAIVDGIFTLINKIIDAVSENAPGILEKFLQLMTDILGIIADNIDDVVQAAIDVVMAFIEGVMDKIPEVVDAGYKMLIEFINGITDAINNNTPVLIEAMQNLFDALVNAAIQVLLGAQESFLGAGKNIVEGLVQGIKNNIKMVVTTVTGMANDILDTVKEVLGIHSPSREFKQIGIYVVQGFCDGIIKHKKSIKSVLDDVFVTNMAGSMKVLETTFKTALETIGEVAKTFVDSTGVYKMCAEQLYEIDGAVYKLTKDYKTFDEIISDVGKELYKESEAYKESTANIEYYNKIIKELKKEKTKLNKELKNSKDKDEIKKKIKEIEEQIKATNDAIIDEEKKMAQDSMRIFNEFYDSFKSNVKSSLNLLSASMDSQTDLFNKFEVDNEITTASILENMESQVEGVREWNSNLDKLAMRGVATGLLDKLREMGPEGAGYVNAFLNMTSSELAKANELFNKETKLSTDTLLNNMKDKLTSVKEWAANMSALAAKGIDQGLLQQLAEMGPEGADYVEAFLNMTAAELGEVNSIYAETVTLPDTVASQLVASYAYAGTDAAKGLAEGLKNGQPEAIQAAEQLAAATLEAVKKVLNINSPSKEFEEIGRYSDSGLVVGLKKYSGTVSSAAEDVGNTAIDSMARTISKISEVIDSDMDSEPVIRPVLDLSGVESGAKSINATLSKTRALSISASVNKSSGGADGGSGVTTSQGTTYQFTQNNYSPKALSRVDIYRQTKNQFAAMKGLV